MPSVLSNGLFDYLPYAILILLLFLQITKYLVFLGKKNSNQIQSKNTDIQAFVQAKVSRIERATGNVQQLQDSSSKYFNPLAGILLLYQLSVIETNIMKAATC